MSIRFFMAWALLILGSHPADACAIWAAAGDKVHNGGTLVGKNLDLPARDYSEFRFVRPRKGYKFLGHLVEYSKPKPAEWLPFLEKKIGVTSGINEKGLVVVCTEVACIKKDERAGLHFLSFILLTEYHSVSGVLEHKAMFAEHAPVFMIIADREKIALLEIAPQGKYSLKVVENGVLNHANHYLEDE